MPITIGRNTRVEASTTLSTPAVTISGITQASQGVVTTAAPHGFANGDVVVLSITDGMTSLNDQICRIASASGATFTLENYDTTGLPTFVAGTVRRVTSWTTLPTTRSVNQGNVSPNRIEITTLADDERQYMAGQSETPEITVDLYTDVASAGIALINAAARSNTMVNFRVRLSDNSFRIFRGTCSTVSESISTGDVSTGQFSIIQSRRRMEYAS